MTLVFLDPPNYAVSSSLTDQYHKYGVMSVIQVKTDEIGSVLPFLFSNDCISMFGYKLASIDLICSVLQSIY